METTTNSNCPSNPWKRNSRKQEQEVQYRDSSDLKVAKAGTQVWTGSKWRAGEVVQEAEVRLRHRRLVGVVI